MSPVKYIPDNGSIARHTIWFIQKSILTLKYLRRSDIGKKNNVVFYIVNKWTPKAGMADNLKTIIGTYYIAKENGFQYRLYFKMPIDIERYFLPNKIDWRCNLDEMNRSVFAAKLSTYTVKYPIPVMKEGFQYHYYWYIGEDIIRYDVQQKGLPETQWYSTFKDRFDELFSPTPFLLDLINKYCPTERQYIALHFRFVNLLGNFEGRTDVYPILNNEQQKELIENCLACIKKISNVHQHLPVFIFSDNSNFLQVCEEKGYNKISEHKVKHTAHSNNTDSWDKTILDFYAIGRSEFAYSIVLPGMYSGKFAQYASIIGGSRYRIISDIDEI